MPKIAICFFGLVKNINHTYRSIFQYLLNPLRSSYEFDFYGHTYDIDKFTNPRNGEFNRNINPRSILDQFSFREFKIEKVENYVSLQEDLKLCLKYGDPWPGTNGISLRNFLLCQRSLSQVTALWRDQKDEYDFIIYFRPDLRFTQPIDLLQKISTMRLENDIYIPDFHSWSGCNDRFSYGRPDAMISYGNRIAYMQEFFEKHRRNIHSERFLKIFLQDHGISIGSSSIRFQRIRSNGQPHGGDRNIS